MPADFALSHGKDTVIPRGFRPRSFSARIADGDGSRQGKGGVERPPGLVFVGRGDDGDVGQAAQIRQVKRALMGCAVGAHQSGAVYGENHRQILQCGVVNELVVSALQKSGVNGDNRAHSLAGHSGGEGYGVLFGDAGVEAAGRELAGEVGHAGSFQHCRGDGDNPRIPLGGGDEPFAEEAGICGRGFWLGGGGAGRMGGRGFFHFQRRDSVKFDRVFFRFGESLSLDGDDVEQLRSVSLAEISQRFGEGEDVVSVHGSDIIESEGLKESAGGERAFDSFAGFFGHFQGGGEEGERESPADAGGVCGGAGKDSGEVISQGADGGGDGHFVVVEDDEQVGVVGGAGVVEGFKSHSAGHGAVADDGGDFAVFALEFCGLGHSKGGGDGGAGVAGAKAVAGAFGAGEEAGDSPPLADGLELVAPSGEDFVRVGLVSDIPDDSVARGLIGAVERDGELDRAEVGGEVSADAKDGVEDKGANVVGEFRQPRERQGAHIGGGFNSLEKVRHAGVRHPPSFSRSAISRRSVLNPAALSFFSEPGML